MVCRKVVCLIILTGTILHAQNTAISGKVTDQSGNAIGGAIVSLESRNLSTTTDSHGTYSLNASVVKSNPVHVIKNSVYLKNNTITVELAKPAHVSIELFDMNGKLLNRYIDAKSSSCSFRLENSNRISSGKTMLVRVSIDKHSTSFRYTPLMSSFTVLASPVSHSSGYMPKLQAALDSLRASALGYKTKHVPISSYEGTFDIILESEYAGDCTPSTVVNMRVSGSGPHSVTVETNSDPGINEGTIYRPTDLGPGKKYPIFVWGEGACSRDGNSNSAAMAEIASHGYLVIADGTPGGSGSRPMNASDIVGMGKPMLAYITWAISENRKPCSAYYQSLDTTKIGSNGFSCGGLLSMGTAHDPRITTWGLTSSGSFSDNRAFWNTVHTPVLILEGHKDETGAYNNGLRDYNGIAPLGHPIMFFSHKNYGHGGDLWSRNGGEFTKINLAWLNWWLKGDNGPTGKGALVGSGCTYCSDSNWEVKSAHLP